MARDSRRSTVTVSEDPAFGNEYFLRADSLTAGLRWSSLISGRFEFGSVSLSRPSLNLVRDSAGRWNMEGWLPPIPPAANANVPAASTATANRAVTAKLFRIDVQGGRINFKQNDDKSAIALLDVAGSVEQDAPGRWQIDLEARPLRAGVELQDIGMLHLRGNIGGTSARLQPAELNLTWSDASLADAMRLLRQSDYGMRGQLSVDLTARVAASSAAPDNSPQPGAAHWMISGVARLQGVHGWRLPGRVTDAAANLAVEAEWRLGERHVKIGKLQLEMPASNLHGDAEADWSHGFLPKLHIESSSLGFADALMWYRAFRPGVSDNLNFEGTLGVDVTLGGWPLQFQQGALASPGGRVTGTALPSPLRIGAINASASRRGLDFAPTEISFPRPSQAPSQAIVPQGTAATPATAAAASGAASSSFILRGAVIPNESGSYRWPPNWNFSVEGSTSRLQDWLALSQALGQPLTSNWTAEGGLAARINANHRAPSAFTQWLGSIDLRNVTLSLPFVNQPIRLPMQHFELTKAQQTVTLDAAEVFGAVWHGTLTRKVPGGRWTFDLFADRLDVAEVDRWLGPRARPGLLARVRAFGNAADSSSAVNSAAASLFARGRLQVDEIILAPMRFQRVGGDVELLGRTIAVRNVQADFYGGKTAGKFEARLLPDPTYDFQGRFDRVDLGRLADDVPSLGDRISGTASANIQLSAQGIGRPNLVSSIHGDGSLDARNTEMRGVNFPRASLTGAQDKSADRFVSAKGNFHVVGGQIEVANFLLDNARNRFAVTGLADFSQALNFQIRPVNSNAGKAVCEYSARFLLKKVRCMAPEIVPPALPENQPIQ